MKYFMKYISAKNLMKFYITVVTIHVAVTICMIPHYIISTVNEIYNIKRVKFGTSYLIQ